MNHPHGGGGRNGGAANSVGRSDQGKKTRSNKRADKFIVRRRSK